MTTTMISMLATDVCCACGQSLAGQQATVGPDGGLFCAQCAPLETAGNSGPAPAPGAEHSTPYKG